MENSNFQMTSLANKSVVERIVDQITNAIITGELKPGDKIPTEVELSNSFGVGRNSIREAIKILEAYGVVEIRRAEGTFVKQEYNHRMLYPILYGIILQKDSKNQLVVLRKVIDIGILQVAMDEMTDNQIKKLELVVKQMEEEIGKEKPSAIKLFDIDVEFHATIVSALDNVLLESIGYYVDEITKRSRILTIERILSKGLVEEFVMLHQEIINMLREKKKSLINEVVEKHYRYWGEVPID